MSRTRPSARCVPLRAERASSPGCGRSRACTSRSTPVTSRRRRHLSQETSNAGRPARQLRRRFLSGRLLQLEPDLQADLEVADRTVDDVAADLGDLEPVQPTQGSAGPADRVADGLLDGVGRGPDQLGHAVRVIHVHLPSARQPAALGTPVGTDPGLESAGCVPPPESPSLLPWPWPDAPRPRRTPGGPRAARPARRPTRRRRPRRPAPARARRPAPPLPRRRRRGPAIPTGTRRYRRRRRPSTPATPPASSAPAAPRAAPPTRS